MPSSLLYCLLYANNFVHHVYAGQWTSVNVTLFADGTVIIDMELSRTVPESARYSTNQVTYSKYMVRQYQVILHWVELGVYWSRG
jgi:hypothetical protein